MQGKAARETPAQTTRTVSLEFKDPATGEHFDVVQDGDLSRDPSEKLSDEGGRERVYPRAERGVQGRRRGAVRPALVVPSKIMDEATGEVLDVVQEGRSVDG